MDIEKFGLFAESLRCKVKDYECSRYARLFAKEHFGIRYASAHAWDRKYVDRIVCEVDSNKKLIDYIKSGLVSPGMMIGVYNPDSKWNDELDSRGNKIVSSHVLLYLGENGGSPIFTDQFASDFLFRNVNDFDNDGLVAKMVTAPKSPVVVALQLIPVLRSAFR